jgi:hypothetical protein
VNAGVFYLLVALVIVSTFLAVLDPVRGADFYSATSPSTDTVENLVSKWWNWWHTVPSDTALVWPECLIGEGGRISDNETVVFLANPSFANDANVNRTNQTCQIPSNQAIFFPLYNSVCDTSMPEYAARVDYSKMLQCAKDSNTEPNAKVYLDGLDVTQHSFEHYTRNPFDLVYAEKNPYEDEPGNYTAVGGGIYVFIRPLPPGDHELRYNYDRQIAAERGDAMYKLTVLKSDQSNSSIRSINNSAFN